MLFESLPPLPLLSCSTCRASGIAGWRTCPACQGLGIGHLVRGRWLYWQYPLERYHLGLRCARRTFNKVRFITAVIIGLNFWVWAGFVIYRAIASGKLALNSNPLVFLGRLPASALTLVWLGVFIWVYLKYRSIREKQFVGLVEHHTYRKTSASERAAASPVNWAEVKKIPRRRRHNIADAFTAESLEITGQAYTLADQAGFNKFTPAHLFYATLGSNRISNLFVRLGFSAESIAQKLAPLFSADNSKTGGTHTAPVATDAVYQTIFQAYEEAYAAHQEYVSVTELLVASVKELPEVQEILYDLGIDKQKLLNVVEWARIREKLYRQYQTFRRAAHHRSTHGMDRAMTAVATPFLNQLSDDLTLLAQFGHTAPCIAREREIEDIFQVVDGGQENVLLVGDFGTGKKSVVEGIAERMVADDVPPRWQDKRLVRLSISSLLAGTTPAGAVERLIGIMNEIARAQNIILYIQNIHELIGVSTGGAGQSLDVASTLAEYVGGGRSMVIATTTPEAYAERLANSKLGTLFAKVDIPEMDENQAIQVLESKVGIIEYKQQVFFAYDAIAKAVALSKRFIRDVLLPGSALEIITEAASLTHRAKGANALVTAEEVAKVIAEKTKIPVTAVTSDESAKLMHLEEALHQRVIGQDEAVTLVANALRRARAEVRSTSKPIANFLFLGPTGVGKTELAKTIAEVYFGGEDRMVRLDMSEYQDKASIYRLIGAPGEKGSGILTEAIRRRPFALLLLDEIEKADKDILNLFLQVMDDGRLTDSTGRVIDFTNVILIATSNAGTSYVSEQLRSGISSDAIKDRLLHGELKEQFRPEFLNRFDGIVLFRALDSDDIKKIAGLMLKRVAKDLDAKGIELKVEDAALDFFARVGFDPEFGARPLRRALQERVENQLAELLLSKKINRRDVIVLGAEGCLTVE
ncbi:MAG: ATP-dependent Clp protease ATP-binding subunit [Candidatus Magasanikbacteria bacterium]|nr:ATP-dependent Clp protease ATP-binding subunit [Candidatus Magasanikbacteria bacterium]